MSTNASSPSAAKPMATILSFPQHKRREHTERLYNRIRLYKPRRDRDGAALRHLMRECPHDVADIARELGVPDTLVVDWRRGWKGKRPNATQRQRIRNYLRLRCQI